MPMTNAEVTNTAAVSVNGYFVFICANAVFTLIFTNKHGTGG
jgi:hypothetical protein